jgi:hypothetical protein
MKTNNAAKSNQLSFPPPRESIPMSFSGFPLKDRAKLDSAGKVNNLITAS